MRRPAVYCCGLHAALSPTTVPCRGKCASLWVMILVFANHLSPICQGLTANPGGATCRAPHGCTSLVAQSPQSHCTNDEDAVRRQRLLRAVQGALGIRSSGVGDFYSAR